MNADFSFPLRSVNGEQWCCLAGKGIRRVDVVGYDVRIKHQYPFTGGHRHRLYTFHGDLHIKFGEVADVALDITAVTPATPKVTAKSRHGKKKRK